MLLTTTITRLAESRSCDHLNRIGKTQVRTLVTLRVGRKAYPWPRRDITNLVGSEHLLTTVVMVMTMTVTADELREGRHGQKLKKDKKKEKEQKNKRKKK